MKKGSKRMKKGSKRMKFVNREAFERLDLRNVSLTHRQ